VSVCFVDFLTVCRTSLPRWLRLSACMSLLTLRPFFCLSAPVWYVHVCLCVRRHLMRGCEKAHSIAWNPHKMMHLPLQCSILLVRQPGCLNGATGKPAKYLFHEKTGLGEDMSLKTLQCGRKGDGLKLGLCWRVLGR
jgi:glutamate/tyrosine decarboxylase-like PLP-dependent enzyme